MGLEEDIEYEGIYVCDERWECKIINMHAHRTINTSIIRSNNTVVF